MVSRHVARIAGCVRRRVAMIGLGRWSPEEKNELFDISSRTIAMNCDIVVYRRLNCWRCNMGVSKKNSSLYALKRASRRSLGKCRALPSAIYHMH